MIDCPCGFGKNITEDQKYCPICGIDLTPLHRLERLPNFYYNMGIKLTEQGQTEKAIEMLMTSISLKPDFALPYIALGDIYMQRGLLDGAIRYYEKALEIEPDNEKIKNSKEKAEKEKSRSKMIRYKETKKASIFKLLLISIPLLTFLIGLVLMPLSQRFLKKQPPINFSDLASEVKRNLLKHPYLSDLNLKIIDSGQGLTISGEVPSVLHKDLITEIAKNVTRNKFINVQKLLIISTAPVQKGKKEEFSYTVKSGDSLSLIAYRFYGDSKKWIKIYEVNKDKINSSYHIFPGEVLSIPIE